MQEGYDRIASDWNALRTGFRPGERDFLDLLLDSLPENASVLDLGCGTGVPNATTLATAGHRITGIDASRELLTIAATTLPGATLIQSSFEAVELTATYQGALCWDSLFHLPRRHHPQVISKLAAALVPGAVLLLTSGGSTQEPFTDTMFGHEFSYDALPPDETIALVKASGFDVIRAELLEKPTGGRNKGRLAIAARKS